MSYTFLHMDTDTESTITVRMPAELKKSVETAAKAEDLTVSQFVRRHLVTLSQVKPAPRRKGTQLRKGATV